MTLTHECDDEEHLSNNYWGPKRIVDVPKTLKSSLGLSIVGGKVEVIDVREGSADVIHGIFIKHIDAESPAATSGCLKTGDHILEINGVDVRNSTYDHAAATIKNAENSIRIIVQSFNLLKKPSASAIEIKSILDSSHPLTVNEGNIPNHERAFAESPIIGYAKISSECTNKSEMSHNFETTETPSENKIRNDETDESSDSEDERHLEGNILTKAGMEISRKSAGNIKRSPGEIVADLENEDEFGYTMQKIKKKYGHLGGQVILIEITKDGRDVGLALAGHKDRMRMGVYICGINPKGAAHKAGIIQEGDEILEVNGHVFQGRAHLNASSLIKKLPTKVLKVILHRQSSNNNLAVQPITIFPIALDEKDQYTQFDDVRTIAIQKGQYGLGIMIVEGKHANVGQGIFASDVQEGSLAEKAGLQVGDMILGVNSDTLLGSSYDDATNILKGAEGLVILTVCNPNKNNKSGSKDNDQPNTIVDDTSNCTKVTSSDSTARGNDDKASNAAKSNVPYEKSPDLFKPMTTEFQISSEHVVNFAIIGGADTPSMGIFINDVYLKSNITMTVPIKCGDQILDFGQENFRSILLEKASSSIMSVSGNIKMTFLRDEKATDELEVDLQKKMGKGIGFCITEYDDKKGVYISDMFDGCSATGSEKLAVGDRILSISSQDVQNLTLIDVATLIKLSSSILMKVARYKCKQTSM